MKPKDTNRSNKNDYVFVAHSGSAYDAQFMYQMAHVMSTGLLSGFYLLGGRGEASPPKKKFY